jgi:hypothetical protein
VVREVFEDSGYYTRAAKLLALYDKNKQAYPPAPDHVYKLYFHCELPGETPIVSIDRAAVTFCREGALQPSP